MKRYVILGIIVCAFIYAWISVEFITLKVVGQPSMTGPIQKNLEQPFFESLQQKTGLPIKVDYRTVDVLGFKDNYQLAMLKSGMFDMVSLRFLQNGQEEPSILGIDLPGMAADFQTARKISDAYGPVIDKNLQQRFEVKLLGLWTFGPQVIFCNKPIHRLSDLKGLKVRVGSSVYDTLIKSQGGIPLVIPFDQVEQALSSNILDCAITSQTSAYSAKWPVYLTHEYPIATQMGTNGIAIRMDTFNKFSESQKQQLQSAVNAYIDKAWIYSEQLNTQASDCLQGSGACDLGVKYNLIKTPVTEDDKLFMRKFAMEQSFPAWAASCDKLDPNCSMQWKATVDPILKQAK
jgi:TRAP-type C4-dicarboxylate transport system substrate-binding protein